MKQTPHYINSIYIKLLSLCVSAGGGGGKESVTRTFVDRRIYHTDLCIFMSLGSLKFSFFKLNITCHYTKNTVIVFL